MSASLSVDLNLAEFWIMWNWTFLNLVSLNSLLNRLLIYTNCLPYFLYTWMGWIPKVVVFWTSMSLIPKGCCRDPKLLWLGSQKGFVGSISFYDLGPTGCRVLYFISQIPRVARFFTSMSRLPKVVRFCTSMSRTSRVVGFWTTISEFPLFTADASYIHLVLMRLRIIWPILVVTFLEFVDFSSKKKSNWGNVLSWAWKFCLFTQFDIFRLFVS